MEVSMNWTDFKSNLDTMSIPHQYYTKGLTYILIAFNDRLTYICQLDIADTDYADWNTNYKALANTKILSNINIEQQTAQAKPFATSVGHSFKGKGFKQNCLKNATTTASEQVFDIYDMTGVEILNGKLGDEIHMKILDDANGTYSGFPNAQLDEFGITWNIRPDVFVKNLPYSARVYPGMLVTFDYTNNDTADRIIYFNLDLHKVVTI